MSLRRKSCNACFQGRRKCDLSFPTCQRCKRTGKRCQYARERLPVTKEYPSSTVLSNDILTTPNELGLNGSPQNLWLSPDFDFATQALPPIGLNLLDELGNVRPLHGSVESWQWVVEQLKECPGNFAMTGENMFIHRSLYSVQSPPAIKAAFGICTASQMVTPATKGMFVNALEGEVSALLDDVAVRNIPEGLSRLQAMVLYQILRFWSGHSKLQSTAEQQKSSPNAWALQLLQRLHTDLPHPRTSKDLMLAESVRRTVMVTFLLHALGSLFKHGICPELPTLSLLPVSVDSDAWDPSDVCAFSAKGDLGTMKYNEWTDMWVADPLRRRLNAFQRMLMVACKGMLKVEELEARMT